MKIGLISDSHDAHENVRRAVAIFKEHGVENVIHAGDICSPPTIRALQAHAEAAFNFFAVFGNNDGERHKLTKLLGDRIDEFLELEFAGITIAVYHGTVIPLRNALIDSGNYDVVVYGHDHNKRTERVGKTLAINPGTAHGMHGTRGTVTPTVAILDTQTMAVVFFDLS